jgi:predicted Zn-dependent protease
MMLLLTACCGCRTMRSATGNADIATARDLTFHGMNALHYGRADQAESLLSQAVDASPCDQRIRQHLATAMVQQGKVDEAIEQLETAIEQCCHDPRLHVELGNLYLQKQQPGTAARYAAEALQINRQNPCAWILQGRCQQAGDDWQSALASFHRAAGLEQADPRVQIHIAETYRHLQRPLQALNALEVYSDNFPEDQVPMDAVLLTADTLMELKQTHRATEQLASATRRPDATAEVWLALGKAHARVGNDSAALVSARQARQLFPDNTQIRDWVASLKPVAPAWEQTAAAATGNRY